VRCFENIPRIFADSAGAWFFVELKIQVPDFGTLARTEVSSGGCNLEPAPSTDQKVGEI
jgi:hypothetical protein